jgi:hypothetical protein
MFYFSIMKSVNRTEKYSARFSPFVMNPVLQKQLGNFHVFRFSIIFLIRIKKIVRCAKFVMCSS